VKNLLRFLFAISLQLSVFSVFAQDTTAYKLRVGDLNLGFDTRTLSTFDSAGVRSFNTYVGGIGLRYQSSILLNHFNKNPQRRFKAGDLFSSEITVGYMNSNDPVQKLPIWFAYRFELGVALLYRKTKDIDLGCNFILLRFARDFVTQNISGSAVDIRLRIKRIVVEGGLDSRALRIVGVPVPYFNKEEEKNMNHVGLCYLLKQNQNLGMRFEWLEKTNSLNGDGLYNLRVYWGKCF